MTAIQWPYYSSVNAPSSASGTGAASSVMGKDQFLKLLIMQLQNQDPASPLQDREFIAQMAQFSALEQMMNMTEQLGLLRQSLGFASSLIGKHVEWVTPGGNGQNAEKGSGIVEAIVLREGKQYAEIGGKLIDMEHIVSVRSRSGGDAE